LPGWPAVYLTGQPAGCPAGLLTGQLGAGQLVAWLASWPCWVALLASCPVGRLAGQLTFNR